MAEHGWSVLCRRAIVDEETKLASIIDAVDRFIIYLSAEDFSAELEKAKAENKRGLSLHSHLALMSWWFRSDPEKDEAGTSRLRFVNPAGRTLRDVQLRIELTGKNIGWRNHVKIPSLPVEGVGRHWFVVEQQTTHKKREHWNIVARLPLDVVLGEPIAPTAT